ncbi:MAG: sodium-dependent transporter [Candidatus Methanomethylophilaceae archaeon]|nr:sodium-dependent transporter [Candidatus Methanomethylophilaceae archaeon]
MSENESRASFSGKVGFVLAASASAVGLGNLWRFPYLTSHYGGGIFVIIYIVLALTFGFSLMIAEVALGRKTGKSCISAFGDLCSKYKWIGIVAALIPLLIVPYYCVIGGWVTKWLATSAIGQLDTLTESGYWWNYITGEISGMADPTIWFLVFAALCIGCIVLGVDRGIERLSKILMPLLLIMMIGIIIYEFTLPNIWDGVNFYLNPDVSKLSAGTFLGAISQIFYSMSLAMGIMITYGSYMKKDVSIERSARNISAIDTSVAILAGLMIIPAAFTQGLGDSSGMGLMFVALPQVFESMPAGEIVAPIFYLLVLFAAMTSAVSLLETVVSVFVDMKKARRKQSIIVSSIILIVLGVITVLGFGPLMIDIGPFSQGAGWLGIFDSITNSVLMPIIAIVTCIFIGYVIKVTVITDEVKAEGMAFRFEKPFTVMIKYVCPILLTFMLVFGLLDLFGIFSLY